jgi:hypothetical protein
MYMANEPEDMVYTQGLKVLIWIVGYYLAFW